MRQARPEIPLPQAQLGLVRTTGPQTTTPLGVDIGGSTSSTADPIGTAFEGVFATGEIGTVTVVNS